MSSALDATRVFSRGPMARIWTATCLLAVVVLSGLAAPMTVVAGESAVIDPQGASQLVTLTNRSRVAAGLPALKVSLTLSKVARWRSRDMIARGYFSHYIPNYGVVFRKLDEKGYCYRLAGENIGWNTHPRADASAAIHHMFMQSTSHRRIIRGRGWDAIGIGAYRTPDGRTMWTVLFADRAGCRGSVRA